MFSLVFAKLSFSSVLTLRTSRFVPIWPRGSPCLCTPWSRERGPVESCFFFFPYAWNWNGFTVKFEMSDFCYSPITKIEWRLYSQVAKVEWRENAFENSIIDFFFQKLWRKKTNHSNFSNWVIISLFSKVDFNFLIAQRNKKCTYLSCFLEFDYHRKSVNHILFYGFKEL